MAKTIQAEHGHIWQRLMALSLCLVLIFLFFFDSWDEIESHEFTGSAMGSWYTIKLENIGSDVDIAVLEADIHAQIALINSLMSTYQDDSELSELNRLVAGSDWVKLSPEVADVLRLAGDIYHETNQLFDPTIKPLVDLWGFGSMNLGEVLPSHQLINRQLELKDFGAISLEDRDDGHTYFRKLKSVTLDLSAIAKGYAVDRVAQRLIHEGVVNYLIEIGGELRVSGVKSDGALWRVAIESPIVNRRSVFRVIEPGDNGVATSGDYRNHREIAGKRYGHVIDPKTGWPVEHETVSVTVVDRSVARADALATALLVMGKDKAINWANEHNQAVLCIYRTETGFESIESTVFEAAFSGRKGENSLSPSEY